MDASSAPGGLIDNAEQLITDKMPERSVEALKVYRKRAGAYAWRLSLTA